MLWLGATLLIWGGCQKPPAGDGQADGNTVLPEDTGGMPTIYTGTVTTFTPNDTGGSTTNLDPGHTLWISQTGIWNFSPSGGPYSAVTGDLIAVELVDDDKLDTGDIPSCRVDYSLTGTVRQNGSCPSCDFEMDVTWFVNEGDPTLCRDPDLPQSDAVWTLGWDPTAKKILFDYYNSGVWLEWFDGKQLGDRISVSWEKTLAVTVEDTGT